MIFVNLPVRDLAKAKAFYEAICAINNPQFSDATSACMVVSDAIFVVPLTHDKWAFFTKKPVADARNASEAMLAISCDTRQAVDTMTDAVAAHGGKADVNPKQDHGFMYGRSFEDLDGHIREPFFMDMSQMPKGAGRRITAAVGEVTSSGEVPQSRDVSIGPSLAPAGQWDKADVSATRR